MPLLLSRFLRGLLLCAGVLATVATSRAWPPPPTYQVDLVTRTAAVYELRAVGAAEGGFDPLLFNVSGTGEQWSEPDGGEVDAGTDIPLSRDLLVHVLERKPTAQEVAALEARQYVEGARDMGRAPLESPFLSGEVTVTESPRWMIFTRAGPGPGIAVSVSFTLPCGEGCGDVLLEDVTIDLE